MRKIFLKNKKGSEISVSTIISLVILIAGFLIILFVYFRVGWSGQTDKEVCHESVVVRATAGIIPGMKEVPLRCRTNKVCITTDFFGSGSCKEFENTQGVTKAGVSNSNDISKEISQEIVDCWSMMGRGTLSMYSPSESQETGFNIAPPKPMCVVCSRIAFDKTSLENKKINLDNIDVLTYMMTHKMSDQNLTYWEYVVGNSPAKIDTDKINKDYLENLITNQENSELAVVFTQISTPTVTDAWKNALTDVGVSTGTFFAVTGGKGIIGTARLAGRALLSPWTYVVAGVIFGAEGLNAERNKAVVLGYCGDVTSGDAGRSGCSVVRVISYNETDLQQYCPVIDSIP